MHTLPPKLVDSIFDSIAENDGVRFARLLKENGQFTHNLINEEALFSLKNYLDDHSILQGLPYEYLTLSHIIAFFDSLECLIVLYKITDDLLKKTDQEFSPLHYAVVGSSMECATFLIKFMNADVNEEVQGKTPIYFAIFANNLEMVRLLFNFNAKLPNSYLTHIYSPISQALRNQNIEILQLLLEKLSDSKDGENNIFASKIPPLLQAISIDLDDAIIPLLKNGCNPNTASTSGERPLFLALKKGKTDIVNNLLQYGANITLKGIHDASVVHAAVESGKVELIKKVLNDGADLFSLDKRQQLPSFYALHLRKPLMAIPVLTYLFEQGLDVNAFDIKNHTILSYALENTNFHNIEFLRFLLDKGADPLFNITLPALQNKPISIFNAVLENYINVPLEIKNLLKQYADKQIQKMNEMNIEKMKRKEESKFSSGFTLNANALNMLKLNFVASAHISKQTPQKDEKHNQKSPQTQNDNQLKAKAPKTQNAQQQPFTLPINPISIRPSMMKNSNTNKQNNNNKKEEKEMTQSDYLEEFLQKMDKEEAKKKKDPKK